MNTKLLHHYFEYNCDILKISNIFSSETATRFYTFCYIQIRLKPYGITSVNRRSEFHHFGDANNKFREFEFLC
jgi:hypothetical protein